ncbi:MAG: hypothetical protein AAF637_14630 [Pseudomonadota bacterium]
MSSEQLPEWPEDLRERVRVYALSFGIPEARQLSIEETVELMLELVNAGELVVDPVLGFRPSERSRKAHEATRDSGSG